MTANSKISSLFSMILTLLILFSGLVLLRSAQAVTTIISVSPSTITASAGQSFNIDIKITDVFDLYAWEFKLSWNSSLLNLVNVIQGPFLQSKGETYFTYKQNDTAGYLVADCTLLGMIPGASGSGVLATITFYVESGGECPLGLYDVILLNSFERPISCETVDGYGYFTHEHDIAVTNVNATPLIVLPDETVNINVTIQNQGEYAENFDVTVYANPEIIGTQQASLDSASSTTIQFAWNTAGLDKGEYVISALASPVPDEVDTADNTKIADYLVTILYNGHDVATVSVEPRKTLVGQGYCMHIAVTVKNYGVFNETFDTAVYVNETLIKTQTVNLASGEELELIAEWNTTNFTQGNYTTSVYAQILPDETNTDDNTMTNGTVRVGVPCDVTGPTKGVPDDVCDMRDIGYFCSKFGTTPSSPEWDSNCDVTGPTSRLPDGTVNMRDIGEACSNFGNTTP